MNGILSLIMISDTYHENFTQINSTDTTEKEGINQLSDSANPFQCIYFLVFFHLNFTSYSRKVLSSWQHLSNGGDGLMFP